MPPTADSFTPISPNPYIVGNPVRDRAMFFGREAEFELVRRRFEHLARGALLVFCGERRSGKTSILFQILDQRLGPDFIPVLIDMQSMATGSEAEFLGKVSAEVLKALGPGPGRPEPPRFTPGTSHAATFESFIQAVLRSRPGQKLILLFDEYELFENKIDSGTLDRDVLNILASLMENQSVFLVFTGSQHLEERRREYWKILGKSIFKTISYLERDDATKLVTQPVAGRVRYDDGVVEKIYRLAAGQPFYTQAICQSLVDHLNENHTNLAIHGAVDRVVGTLINNPLPQMIFLWDGLEQDEKLTLALLAEVLPDPGAHASVEDVRRAIRRREYPLDLDTARISTALEKLFKSEMALRDDSNSPPGYAFRMDLWRLWIRRQHSVWQVMREAGLEIRTPTSLKQRKALVVGGFAAGVAAVLAAIVWLKPLPQPPPRGPTSHYALHAIPDHAVIELNGRRIGIGTFTDAMPAGPDQHMKVSAPGYADSEFTLRLEPGVPTESRIALRPLLADLRVQTNPTGAEIRVDGKQVGLSPMLVRDLRVAEPHVVSASLRGYSVAEGRFQLVPGTVTPALLTLVVGRGNVLVITDPPGAEIRVDDDPRGRSPVRLDDLALGRHQIIAERSGYDAAETTVTVLESTREIGISLPRSAPGELVIQGDVPASIYIDGRLIVENVQNSGVRELDAGEHTVRVVLLNNEAIDRKVDVWSKERVIYDFTRNTMTRRLLRTP